MTLRYDSPRSNSGQAGQASYVLAGNSESKKNFLLSFIKEENIKSYNLFDYQETLKIPQVREIKKLLSTKAISGAKRLFVIRDATLEAQNALLKTLEELPDDTTFIFLDDSNLIPTIVSRSRVLNFERTKVNINENVLDILKKFIDGPPAGPLRQSGSEASEADEKDLSSALFFSDELFSQNPDLNFADLTLSFREILFGKVSEGDFEKSDLILTLLKSLYEYVPLVENNNLNKRLLFERLLIEKISS